MKYKNIVTDQQKNRWNAIFAYTAEHAKRKNLKESDILPAIALNRKKKKRNIQ